METRRFPRLVSKGNFVNQFVLEPGLGAGQRRLNSFAPKGVHQDGRPGQHYQGKAIDAENKDDQVFDDLGTILFSAHSRRGGRIFGFFLPLEFRLPFRGAPRLVENDPGSRPVGYVVVGFLEDHDSLQVTVFKEGTGFVQRHLPVVKNGFDRPVVAPERQQLV